jgi:hypothetical protein
MPKPIEETEARELSAISFMGIDEAGEIYRCVLETYGSVRNQLSPDDARIKASELFRAAGIAESACGLVKLMFFKEDTSQGFGRKSKQLHPEDLAKRATKAVSVMMQEVEPLPEDIQVSYGFKFSQKKVFPMVHLTWGEDSVTLELDAAKNHAKILFVCAEAVQTDEFLTSFIGKQLGMELGEVQAILREFSAFRQQQYLQSLFQK